MIKYLICCAFAISIGETACLAQTNNPQAIGAWGKNNCGAQLGICFGQNVLKAGNHTHLIAGVRNTSTNIILLKGLSGSGSLTITNKGGKAYQLTQMLYNRGSGGLQYSPIVGPGKVRILSSVEVIVGLDVEPGDYEFSRETRTFNILSSSGLKAGMRIDPGDYEFSRVTNNFVIVSNEVCTLLSNPLKLRVVRESDTATTPPEIITNSPDGMDETWNLPPTGF